MSVTPQNWQVATTILILKKKDTLSIENYRPITLLEILFKLWEKILQIRVRNYIEMKFCLSPNQFGCRRKLGADMAIFATQSLIDEAVRNTNTLLMLHIDLSKAYNRIPRISLWVKLWKLGVRGKLWKAIISTYDNPTEFIKLGALPWPSFSLSDGLRQGSVLSPLLFIIFMDELLKLLEISAQGASTHGIHTPCISYVDDLQLIASSWTSLISLCHILLKYCLDYGLVINIGKSILLSNLCLDILFSNIHFLPFVVLPQEQHTYVGAIVGFLKSKKAHIIYRLTQARIKMRNMQHNGMKYEGLSPHINLFLFKTVILPKALYGLNALGILPTKLWVLSQFQLKMLSILLNSDPLNLTPNSWKLHEIGLHSIPDAYRASQLRLYWRILNIKGPNTARAILLNFELCSLNLAVQNISTAWATPKLKLILQHVKTRCTLKTVLRDLLHARAQALIPQSSSPLLPWFTKHWKGPVFAHMHLTAPAFLALCKARAELTFGSYTHLAVPCTHCDSPSATLEHALHHCTWERAVSFRLEIIQVIEQLGPANLASWLASPIQHRAQSLLGLDVFHKPSIKSQLATATASYLLSF